MYSPSPTRTGWAAPRGHVVALGRDDGEVPVDTATNPRGDGTPHVAGASEIARPASHPPDSPQRTAARSRWARLLARNYEVFPLLCPGCGAEMRIIAFITAAEPVETMLRHDVDDGREIIWMSERDGRNHLYLYDGETGRVKNRITQGEWVVRDVVHVDEEDRRIYFAASGMNDLVGAVLLVARNGKVVLHDAVGLRDREAGLPLEKSTLFRMASNTKPVIATGVAMLVERDSLAYDTPVRRYIPSFDNYRPASSRCATCWATPPASASIRCSCGRTSSRRPNTPMVRRSRRWLTGVKCGVGVERKTVIASCSVSGGEGFSSGWCAVTVKA